LVAEKDPDIEIRKEIAANNQIVGALVWRGRLRSVDNPARRFCEGALF
jgi:hypothetical protein